VSPECEASEQSALAKLVRAKDQRPRRWLECTIGESLNERDGFRWLFDNAEPSKVGTHDADELVAHFFGVHDGAMTRREEGVQFNEETAAPVVNDVTREKRNVAVGNADFFVRLQVVWRTTHADDAVEVILAQPDDFLLTTHLSVAGAETTRALADCQAVFDDPCQIARLNSERPLAAKFL